MAERGEIDPWNIDIVEVTDRFLSALEMRRSLDLRISGRTLLYASILVRMKSEYLGDSGIFESRVGEEGDALDEDNSDLPGGPGGLVAHGSGPMEVLEREISRRLSRKHLRKRPVTLIELILVLKEAERTARRRRRSSQEIAESMISAEDVVSIAHEERYFEAAFTVMTCWDEEGDATLVSTLAEIAKRLGWKVQDVYIPLLFLMFEGKVELSQDEIFGELNVTRCRAAE